MDEIARAIGADIHARYGWLRRLEVKIRGAACVVALVVAVALIFGFWQPSAERAGQWVLALVLLWGAMHLLRSLIGADRPHALD